MILKYKLIGNFPFIKKGTIGVRNETKNVYVFELNKDCVYENVGNISVGICRDSPKLFVPWIGKLIDNVDIFKRDEVYVFNKETKEFSTVKVEFIDENFMYFSTDGIIKQLIKCSNLNDKEL